MWKVILLIPIHIAVLALLTKIGTTYESSNTENDDYKLILILLDGFRWDYFHPDHEGFQKMFREGVKADYLQSVFPSLSLPNYYSIATGLYAESHGIIHNYMYDPPTKRRFNTASDESDFDSMWWNNGDPIWITATRQNVRSQIYYWLGCEAVIRGLEPDFCKRYISAPGMPNVKEFADAIDNTINRFTSENFRFSGMLVALTDTLGHNRGPYPENNTDLYEALKDLDAEILRLVTTLENTPMPDKEGTLADYTNIIIVSDHGMAYSRHRINLTDIIAQSGLDADDIYHYETYKETTVAQMWPLEEKEDEFYTNLTGKHPHMHVYKKDMIPEKYHVLNNIRTPPVLLVADVDWYIDHRKPNAIWTTSIIANHGYNPAAEEMRGIFIAWGPHFKPSYRQAGFENVHVYQVMCHILNLKPSPHNGSWDVVQGMMQTPRPSILRHKAGMWWL